MLSTVKMKAQTTVFIMALAALGFACERASNTSSPQRTLEGASVPGPVPGAVTEQPTDIALADAARADAPSVSMTDAGVSPNANADVSLPFVTDAAPSSTDATSPVDAGSLMVPAGSVGTYEVPVPTALAAAATFTMNETHWRVDASGKARLSYDLPIGLVGGIVRVSFEGPYDASTQTATMTGPPGTSVCSIAGSTLVCHETMPGLLPIAADPTIIAAAAAADYAGPLQHRVDVAALFGGDPVGILRVNLFAVAGRDRP
jgi:hypothetical protein